jgi:hypothetical protein
MANAQDQRRAGEFANGMIDDSRPLDLAVGPLMCQATIKTSRPMPIVYDYKSSLEITRMEAIST